MNFRSIFLSLLGWILLVVVIMADPSAQGAGEPDRVAALEARMETLEKERALDARELTSLRSRVAELERASRQGKSTTRPGSSSNDVAQLKRDNSTLQRAIRNVDAKASTNGQTATQLRREVDRLRQQVSTLENTVQRLQR